MVICQGCGHSFEVPGGYTRNKIQCPGCGVICPVPAEASSRAAPAKEGGKRPPRQQQAPSVEEDAAQWLSQPEPESVPLFDDEPAPPPVRKSPPKKTREMLVPCRRCGGMIRKQRECPVCDREELPAAAPQELDLEDAAPGDDSEDDASPYLLADKDIPFCPKCKKEMPESAVLCAGCGFDLRTRKKVARTYQPISRSWESDLNLQQRLFYLGLAWAVHFLLAMGWMFSGFSPTPFIVSWPLLTILLCFVLGTYDRIELERDQKGRTKVRKQWRFCFVPLAPVTTPVRGFEGVTTGAWNDAGVLEWVVFLGLLLSGVIPAIVYWYNAIYKIRYHVALASDHGRAEVYLYRGTNEHQMSDISETVCNVTGLRLVN